jgi:transcriptional regulator
MTKKPDNLQGTLDLLILKTLARGRQHGYGIALHIERCSNDFLRVEEGSLYPALHRMEQSGWIRAEWALTTNSRRARFYGITPAGRAHLAEIEAHWLGLTGAVARVLRFA